jgi:hypothetical protein
MADYETDRANALRLLVETAGCVEDQKFLIFRPIVYNRLASSSWTRWVLLRIGRFFRIVGTRT